MAEIARQEGHEQLKRGELYKALILYNKALCNALPQELTFIYENRSAVYFQAQLFDECLENINLARRNSSSNEITQELDLREKKCRELIEQSQPDAKFSPWNYFKLTYPANDKIPFIANNLELRENEKFGRHIITMSDLKAGDIIAVEETAFKLIAADSCFSRCYACWKPNNLNLIPCFQSKGMHYSANETIFQMFSLQ